MDKFLSIILKKLTFLDTHPKKYYQLFQLSPYSKKIKQAVHIISAEIFLERLP